MVCKVAESYQRVAAIALQEVQGLRFGSLQTEMSRIGIVNFCCTKGKFLNNMTLLDALVETASGQSAIGLFVKCHVVELAKQPWCLEPSGTSPSERPELLFFGADAGTQ